MAAAKLAGTTLAAMYSARSIADCRREQEQRSDTFLLDTLRGRDNAVFSLRTEQLTESSETKTATSSSSSSSSSRKSTKNIATLTNKKKRSGVWISPFKLGEAAPQGPYEVSQAQTEQLQSQSQSQSSSPLLTAATLSLANQQHQLQEASLAANSNECDAAITSLISRPDLMERILTEGLKASNGASAGAFARDSDSVSGTETDIELVARILNGVGRRTNTRNESESGDDSNYIHESESESGLSTPGTTSTTTMSSITNTTGTGTGTGTVTDDDIDVYFSADDEIAGNQEQDLQHQHQHPAMSPVLASLLDTVSEVVQDEGLIQETRRILASTSTASAPASASTIGLTTHSHLNISNEIPDGEEEGSTLQSQPQLKKSSLVQLQPTTLPASASVNTALLPESVPVLACHEELLEKWEELRESYQCGICLDLLSAPKLADCTHSYCGFCYDAYIASIKGEPVSIFEPVEPRNINDIVNMAAISAANATVTGASASASASAGAGIPGIIGASGCNIPNTTGRSKTNESAMICPELCIKCPTCRDIISTCTFERVLDRDLAYKVDNFHLLYPNEWKKSTLTTKKKLNILQNEWHTRRKKYQANEWSRQCSGKSLKDRVRVARARAAVNDNYSAYQGRESRFLDSYYSGATYNNNNNHNNNANIDSGTGNDDDDDIYDVASKLVVPLAMAVLMLIVIARGDRR